MYLFITNIKTVLFSAVSVLYFEHELVPSVFISQQIFTWSMSTIEALEKGVNFEHSSHLFSNFSIVNFKQVSVCRVPIYC